MIKIAIAEDETCYIKQLLEYLQVYQKERSVELETTVYRDGDQILEDFRSQFNLILLDVEMQFVDGLTAAEEIRKLDENVIIVFISNLKQYAIRGYEVRALDYILKPISYFMLSQTLDKALEEIEKHASRFLLLPIQAGVKKLDIRQLYYVESSGHILHYHAADGVYSVRGNMVDLEVELKDNGFFRCNKGYLVNLQYVESVEDSNCRIHKDLLPIARLRRKAFMEALMLYISV